MQTSVYVCCRNYPSSQSTRYDHNQARIKAFPNDQYVTAKPGALLGDMVATHKVAGFSSHSGKKPCLWCQVSNTQLVEMKIGHLCNRIATLATSRDWLKADQTKCKELVKKSGVWSSTLNQLPYWDPVNNVVLGVMHDWFEGVLQHHFWFFWGLNGTPALTRI
ncbi:hypothetical protein VP01_1264g4 [Puccinia sorghi]|uniref:Uncharacterized protein n=1 Tax=Puccinia sorghi TaxID=27349 RepID=A0A0L6VP31_9BASI|nr:hypothetical protein VP01_1264g4 [Puccinia sorghi]